MPSRWIEFVKEWASKHNIAYGCALSDPDMKVEYHKRYNTKKHQEKKKEVKYEKLEEAIPTAEQVKKPINIQIKKREVPPLILSHAETKKVFKNRKQVETYLQDILPALYSRKQAISSVYHSLQITPQDSREKEDYKNRMKEKLKPTLEKLENMISDIENRILEKIEKGTTLKPKTIKSIYKDIDIVIPRSMNVKENYEYRQYWGFHKHKGLNRMELSASIFEETAEKEIKKLQEEYKTNSF